MELVVVSDVLQITAGRCRILGGTKYLGCECGSHGSKECIVDIHLLAKCPNIVKTFLVSSECWEYGSHIVSYRLQTAPAKCQT